MKMFIKKKSCIMLQTCHGYNDQHSEKIGKKITICELIR